MNELSIVIPTYNRKDRLMSLLEKIYQQEASKKVNIVICDNNSNYDVEKEIYKTFNHDKLANLKVVKNQVNVGMCANLALIFFSCKTKWMWSLSDDDIIKDNAIEMILNDIQHSDEIALLKYSLLNIEDDIEISTLPELIDFYCRFRDGSGDLIFLSNNVYNLEKIMPYYGNSLSNCYCAIAHMLPVFNVLDNNSSKVRIKSTKIVDFVKPESYSWNYLNVVLGISTIVYYNYNLEEKNIYKLARAVTGNFSHFVIIQLCLDYKPRHYGKFLYKEIYRKIYKNSNYLLDKIYYLFFYFLYYTHIRISRDSALKIRSNVRKFFPNFR